MNPDLGPYCLQLRRTKVHKHMREQAKIDVNGGKGDKIKLLIHTVGHCLEAFWSSSVGFEEEPSL